VRASTEDVDVADPDAKPLEELSAEERVALYARLLGELGEPEDGEQVHLAGATFPRGVSGSRD
jgi:hypothetical protein